MPFDTQCRRMGPDSAGLAGLPLEDLPLLTFLGPVGFYRLIGTCNACRYLKAPSGFWSARWRVPESPSECQEVSLGLLHRCAQEQGEPAEGWEAILDHLFVLTAAGRPAGFGALGPSHNPLDLAVEHVLRPAIPLLCFRGYTLELLDVLSLESVVQRDSREGVAAYLDAGMSPDVRANAGRSVLMVACAFTAGAVAELLIERGADVHQQSGFGGWTALMWAAHFGWVEGCELLLKARARVDDINAQGATPLDIAIRHGRQDVLEVLSRSALA